MLPAKGAGVTHRVSGADARRNDQLGGKVDPLATAKTKPGQGRRTKREAACAALFGEATS
jgi:hypothetical protein